jgi:hypothetical protein
MFNTQSSSPPLEVKAVPLYADIIGLNLLFQAKLPPKWPVQPSQHATVIFGFGDALGRGFGSTLLVDNVIHYHHGQWTEAYSEESSNYRELSNLVHAIENATREGLLVGRELFFFTDNMTAECAFHKGSSSSPMLFLLVLCLQTLQMYHNLFIHVIHVAGMRMKVQGTDGLS